jgi:polyisoprenoid-binding protein YceI
MDIGPDNGTLTVHTSRAGVAARAGHDLTLEVKRWSGVLELDPAVLGNASLEATIDTTSFEVREGSGGMKPLTDSDKSDIINNLASKVLNTDRNSTITFKSTSAMAVGGGVTINGDLTISGTTKPVGVNVTVDGDSASGVARIDQPQFGIRPFSALMGTLKVAPEVEIRAQVRL